MFKTLKFIVVDCVFSWFHHYSFRWHHCSAKEPLKTGSCSLTVTGSLSLIGVPQGFVLGSILFSLDLLPLSPVLEIWCLIPIFGWSTNLLANKILPSSHPSIHSSILNPVLVNCLLQFHRSQPDIFPPSLWTGKPRQVFVWFFVFSR